MKDPQQYKTVKPKRSVVCGWSRIVCPRDSIVMAATIDYWVDEFATITVHFVLHGGSFVCTIYYFLQCPVLNRLVYCVSKKDKFIQTR